MIIIDVMIGPVLLNRWPLRFGIANHRDHCVCLQHLRNENSCSDKKDRFPIPSRPRAPSFRLGSSCLLLNHELFLGDALLEALPCTGHPRWCLTNPSVRPGALGYYRPIFPPGGGPALTILIAKTVDRLPSTSVFENRSMNISTGSVRSKTRLRSICRRGPPR